MEMDRVLMRGIISKWKDIRALRQPHADQSKCINTSAKLLIRKYAETLLDLPDLQL